MRVHLFDLEKNVSYSIVSSTWGDLGSLRGLFVTFLLLYFVDIIMYLNFGKGFKS
jgi:hypothetical protein